jgi:hypothetical protein
MSSKPTDDLTYDELLDQIRLLSVDEQISLLRELEALIHIRKHSIRELRGLGKETWQGIDVEEYIEEERNSWDRE